MILIYKNNTNGDLIFINREDNLSLSLNVSFTYTHISTIDPCIILSKIYKICNEDFSSDEKIDDILRTFINE